MSDKTQLDQLKEILTFVWEKGVVMDITDNGKIAQQIFDICQPQWVEVTDDPPDIQWCRVIIGEYEQEMFYRCENGVWLRQGDNGSWIASAFIPSYYFIKPPPPEDTA